MKIHRLQHHQELPLTLDGAWAFFSDPRNLNAITPPELRFRMISGHEASMFEGQILCYRIRLAPGLWHGWVTEIKSVRPHESFIDEQRFGPYKFWHHRHTFREMEGGVTIGDEVHYALPFGILGGLMHRLAVRPKIERIFAFRRQALESRFG